MNTTNIPVLGKTLGKYSTKITIGRDGFFTVAQESPGSGEMVFHFSSAKSVADTILQAAEQAEAAYKLQAK